VTPSPIPLAITNTVDSRSLIPSPPGRSPAPCPSACRPRSRRPADGEAGRAGRRPCAGRLPAAGGPFNDPSRRRRPGCVRLHARRERTGEGGARERRERERGERERESETSWSPAAGGGQLGAVWPRCHPSPSPSLSHTRTQCHVLFPPKPQPPHHHSSSSSSSSSTSSSSFFSPHPAPPPPTNGGVGPAGNRPVDR
jgi:hypothetical protein